MGSRAWLGGGRLGAHPGSLLEQLRRVWLAELPAWSATGAPEIALVKQTVTRSRVWRRGLPDREPGQIALMPMETPLPPSPAPPIPGPDPLPPPDPTPPDEPDPIPSPII